MSQHYITLCIFDRTKLYNQKPKAPDFWGALSTSSFNSILGCFVILLTDFTVVMKCQDTFGFCITAAFHTKSALKLTGVTPWTTVPLFGSTNVSICRILCSIKSRLSYDPDTDNTYWKQQALLEKTSRHFLDVVTVLFSLPLPSAMSPSYH